MTDFAPAPKRSLWQKRPRVSQWIWVPAIASIIFWIISASMLADYPGAELQFRLDLGKLLTIPVVLKIHIASALTAFFVGLWILAGPKGTGMHRKLGWVWVIAMASTALSSFFLSGANGQSFSWIHGLSAWTLIGLPAGIAAIRKKDVKKHAKNMTGMFLGAMVIAGLFTFLPGRLMWSLFFTI